MDNYTHFGPGFYSICWLKLWWFTIWFLSADCWLICHSIESIYSLWTIFWIELLLIWLFSYILSWFHRIKIKSYVIKWTMMVIQFSFQLERFPSLWFSGMGGSKICRVPAWRPKDYSNILTLICGYYYRKKNTHTHT